MKHWLTRLGLWIAQLGYWPSPALVERARVLCREQEQPGVSGEYKRHQVYARLIKEYPAAAKRTLGLAIELSLMT